MIIIGVVVVFSTNVLPYLIQEESDVPEYSYETSFQVARPLQNVNEVKDSECMGTAKCITGKVTQIIDGDTIYVESQKIRLALVDSPEKGTPGFNEATEFTRMLCPVGTNAMVDQDDNQMRDKYGRIIGMVTCADMNLNKALLESNHAIILTGFCDESEFSSETWAKQFGC